MRSPTRVGLGRAVTAALMGMAALGPLVSRSVHAQQPSTPRKTPATRPTTVEQRIRAVETGLVPSVRIKGKPLAGMTLQARMKKYHVGGVSIAVINEDAVEWVKAYGTVDTGTVFQTGELSQTVAAIAALRLVQGKKLELNRDVNRKLKSWKLPKSDFTKNNPVTLRALLAHSAGLTVTRPQAYEPGTKLPTITQVLYGTPPATNRAVGSIETPGQSVHFAAADYDVVQQLVEDVTRQSFATFAGDSVLAPLGMTHSSFAQPPDDALAQRATVGHDAAGKLLSGKWRIYPEVAAAGLWSTPRDLAQMVVEIQMVSGGRPGKVLRTEFAEQLLTAEHAGWPGLGVRLEGENESARFQMSGATAGFEAALVGLVERGQGAVVMTNTGEGGALVEEILNAIASVYGWRKFVPGEKVLARVDPKAYGRFVGRYGVDSREVSVTKRGNRLFIGPVGKETTELLPESVSDFFTSDPAAAYSFVFDDKGKVRAFTQRQRGASMRWDRKS